MIEQGRILDVTEENTGSELLQDAAVNATVLYVQDAYDFNQTGGSLDLNGALLTYTSADPDTDTITLAAPLAVAALAEDPVLVYPYGTVKVALVDLYDQDDAQRAIVPFAFTAALDVGIRDELDQEQVYIGDDHGRWEVVALDEEIPGYDGGYILPGTLPDPSTPSDPPSGSPTLTGYGTLDAIILRATSVTADVSIQYHMSKTQGFTPDSTTLLPGTPTKSLVYVATADPSGHPLALGTDYYFKAVAENVVGTGPVGTEIGPVQLDPGHASDVVASEVVAGFILTGKIQVGVAYLDANEGLVMPQPDGGTITLPVDGVTPAQITAYVIAKAMTIQNDLIIQGTGTIRGQLSMSQGVSNPTTKPTITQYWPSVAAALSDFQFNGLAEHSSTQFAAALSFFGGNIRLINKADGSFVSDAAAGKAWTNNFQPVGGLAKIGSYYYVLGQDFDRSTSWYLYKIDATTFDKVSESSGMSYANPPAIGSDGTNPLLVWVDSANSLRMRTFDPSAMTYSNSTIDSVSSGQSTAWYTVQFVGQGGYGDGTARLYIMLGGWNDTVRAYVPGTFVRDSSRDFYAAGNTTKGMCYDSADGAIASYDNGGNLFKYGTYTVKQDVNAAYTWYDGNATGGTHETAVGPTATFLNMKPRSYIKIETPPAPDADDTDPTHTDKADQIKIYASVGTGVAVKYQNTMVTPTRSTTYKGSFATVTAPPATNGFTSVVGGSSMGRFYSAATRVQSGLPKTDIWGDGTGRLDAICPPGTILMYGGTTSPAGFLICDGSAFSSTTYPDLAAVLGDTFGVHSGTTYYLPDFRNRLVAGVGSITNLGHNDGDAEASRTPYHNHNVPGQSGGTALSAATGSGQGGIARFSSYDGHQHGGTVDQNNGWSGGTSRTPHLAVNMIIKT